MYINYHNVYWLCKQWLHHVCVNNLAFGTFTESCWIYDSFSLVWQRCGMCSIFQLTWNEVADSGTNCQKNNYIVYKTMQKCRYAGIECLAYMLYWTSACPLPSISKLHSVWVSKGCNCQEKNVYPVDSTYSFLITVGQYTTLGNHTSSSLHEA